MLIVKYSLIHGLMCYACTHVPHHGHFFNMAKVNALQCFIYTINWQFWCTTFFRMPSKIHSKSGCSSNTHRKRNKEYLSSFSAILFPQGVDQSEPQVWQNWETIGILIFLISIIDIESAMEYMYSTSFYAFKEALCCVFCAMHLYFHACTLYIWTLIRIAFYIVHVHALLQVQRCQLLPLVAGKG